MDPLATQVAQRFIDKSASDRTYYHGTSKDYEKPKLNGIGILWLARNPVVASHYALPHWNEAAKGFVWKIALKGGAKVLDLGDLDNPIIREAFDGVVLNVSLQVTPSTRLDFRNFGSHR